MRKAASSYTDMDKLSKSIIAQLTITPKLLLAYFKSREAAWQFRRELDVSLLYLALACLVMSALLLLNNGLETLFWPLHTMGRQLLPDFAWQNITFIGDTYTALAIALLFSYRFPKLTLAILISAVVGTLFIHGLKHALDTARPPAVLIDQGLEVIGPMYKRNSMPSGHTATAFILATLLTRCIRISWKKMAIIAVAFLVAWSRVACGVHWPADVLMGAAIGIVSGVIGLRLSDLIRLKINAYLFVIGLLMFSAVSLFEYDGGFDHTKMTANIIGFTSIFYFCASWLFEVTKPLIKSLLEWD